jgi:uncharacterized protein YgiM (DUF1202 family)
MKMNNRLLFTALILAGLAVRPALADQRASTNLPPLLPPPTLGTPATKPIEVIHPTEVAPTAAPVITEVPPAPEKAKPAAKKSAPAKKKVAAKPAAKPAKAAKSKAAAPTVVKFPEFSTPLHAGAATVSAKHVNIRAQASTKSEVLGHLNTGDAVTVIEEVTRENHKADEPTVWAKIALPNGTNAWVNGQFVDATSHTVSAKKLNVRGGPGENFSVIATLQKGDTLKQVNEKNGWLQVEVPSTATAFVAAAYLKQEVAVPVEPVPPAPVEPTPVPTPVADATPVAAPPTTAPDGGLVVVSPTPTPAAKPDVKPATKPAPKAPEVFEKRIVDREGIVKSTWSIIAPADFKLVSAETGETVDYLYTSSTNLDLRRYKGMHIIVTGEEGLDVRWKDTPVLTIRRIQVIE